MKNILLYCLSIFLLFSCNGKLKEQIDNEKTLSDKTQQDTDIKSFNNNQLINVLSGDSLTIFLPEKIPGTEKGNFKTGTRDDGDFIVTTGSCEYVFDNKGFLNYCIMDYGSIEAIPKDDLRLFEKLPEVSGKETYPVTIENGKGYIIWDDFKNEGSFYGLINNRFYLQIDGYLLPKNINNLNNHIKYFNLKGLGNIKSN